MPSDEGLRLDDLHGIKDRWKQAIEDNKKNNGLNLSVWAATVPDARHSPVAAAPRFSASSRHMGLKGVVIRVIRRRNRAIMAQA